MFTHNKNSSVEQKSRVVTLGAGDVYRHYRTQKLYRVIGCGHHTETEEEVVIYQALYNDPKFGNNHIWVRPKTMFLEQVMHEGKNVNRFEFVEK